MEKKFFSKVMLSAVVATSLIAADIQLESHGYHAIYLSSDGTVWTWGGRGGIDGYVLGQGADTNSTVLTPTKISGLSNIVDIATAPYAAFAVDSSKKLYAWGQEFNGQFGDNNVLQDIYSVPTYTGVDGVLQVSTGYYGTSILKDDGFVYTAGYSMTQAGFTKIMIADDTPNDTTDNAALLNVVQLASGDYHHLAVTSDGKVYAWGGNAQGQLGNTSVSTGIYANSKDAVEVTGLTNVVKVAAGGSHSVALTSSGEVYAWGNGAGGLNGSTTASIITTATKLNVTDVKDISAGSGSIQLIKTDGTILGLGNNPGQFGSGTTSGAVTTLQAATITFPNALIFTGGDSTSYVVDENGSLYASGKNTYGQQGDGTTIDSTVFDTNTSWSFATLTNTQMPCNKDAILAEGKAYVVANPSEFGLFTTTQITTQLNDLNTTLTTQYETQLNELNTTLTTQYATQLNEMNTTAYANGIAYVLSHLTEHNLTTKALFDTAVADGASALSTCNAEKLTEYNSGYDIGFVAGEDNVTNTPSAYGLVASSSCSTSTLTQEDLYAEFIKGKNEVIDNPSSYGLVASSDIINATGNSVNIKKGWALYGFDRAIDVLSKFSEEYRITSIWGYDTASGKWKAFSPDSYYKVLIADAGLEELSQLNKNEGFWINSKTDFTFTMEDEDNNVTEVTHNGITYGFITSSVTGKVWLDKNLGATQACTTNNDTDCYGDYYQWGRSADGHELADSNTTSTQSASIEVINSDFIKATNADWTTTDTEGTTRSTNWLKTDGSSICPTGFRVPTVAEYTAETLTDASSAYDALKMPLAGNRDMTSGQSSNVGTYGYYWTADAQPSSEDSSNRTLSHEFTITSTSVSAEGANYRSYGYSVRCIKN